MKTELSDIDRAFLVFNARLDNLLRGMGAQMLPGGAYLLNTPAGPLRVAINGNWMIGYFASPLGGRLATKNGSDLHSGKWRYYCPQNVKALCDPRKVEDFAMKLDDVLAFKPTSGQRLLIEQDLRDRRRYIKSHGRSLRRRSRLGHASWLQAAAWHAHQQRSRAIRQAG